MWWKPCCWPTNVTQAQWDAIQYFLVLDTIYLNHLSTKHQHLKLLVLIFLNYSYKKITDMTLAKLNSQLKDSLGKCVWHRLCEWPKQLSSLCGLKVHSCIYRHLHIQKNSCWSRVLVIRIYSASIPPHFKWQLSEQLTQFSVHCRWLRAWSENQDLRQKCVTTPSITASVQLWHVKLRWASWHKLWNWCRV